MALSRKSSELNTILSIYAEVKRAQHSYSVAKQFSMSSLSFKKDKRDNLLCDLIKALELIRLNPLRKQALPDHYSFQGLLYFYEIKR